MKDWRITGNVYHGFCELIAEVLKIESTKMLGSEAF